MYGFHVKVWGEMKGNYLLKYLGLSEGSFENHNSLSCPSVSFM